MFGAVMVNPEYCRDFLELTLGFPIERVEVDKEKSLVYHPEYKGVRLDVYAKDKNNTHYNVEMQVLPKPELRKRVRYYHGQIDMELLLSGQEYSELPVKFLKFVKADYSESTKDFEDAFVGKLQDAVRRIKESREMEERYMILEEMLRDERAEGRAEGKAESVLELLEEIGSVPEELRERILGSTDLQILNRWLKQAAKAESIEQFIKELQ